MYINTWGVLWPSMARHREAHISRHLVQICPEEVKQDNTPSAFLFQFSQCKQVFFRESIYVLFFAFLCFLLVTLLFKVAPKHSNEVLYSVPKREKAIMCLYGENMYIK